MRQPIIVTHDEFDNPIEQGDPNWFALREGRPTASAFNRILTPAQLKPSKAESYIHELVAQRFGVASDSFQSEDMENGIKWEKRARAQYALDHEPEVREVAFIFEDHRERCGGSPDGVIGDIGGVEIKSPKPETHVGYLLANEVPRDYIGQVYGSLWLSQRDWWDFFSYSKNLPNLRVRVNADDKGYTAWQQAFEPALEDFLERYDTATKQIQQRQDNERSK